MKMSVRWYRDSSEAPRTLANGEAALLSLMASGRSSQPAEYRTETSERTSAYAMPVDKTDEPLLRVATFESFRVRGKAPAGSARGKLTLS